MQIHFINQKLKNYQEMIKTENRAVANEPVCKKIQNYIFKFSDLLGQGNFSKVYKAHHQITNETVAIKIIQLNSLKSQKLQQLLFSEIDVLKKLNHPNILRCYEVFTSNRNCYIITEICNGGDLESKLRRQHHFSQQSAQPIIKDIFSGLLYLAQKNVIHRDLKVANVFLHNGRAKIADFGFAKFTRENFKDINIGSPIYMSPQGLIHNIYGPKTDIWAFGILIYQLLHGQTPYAHCRTEAQLKYHVNIPINSKKIRPELSPQIKQIITLCMQIDQSKRITAIQLEQLPYFRRLLEKSPLKRMESPQIQKKFSSGSQRQVGQINTYSQQAIQRHNFLLPKDDQTAVHLPNYRGQQNQKSKSPIGQSNKINNSYNQFDNRGNFSTQKRVIGFNRQRNQSYQPRLTTPYPQNPTLASQTQTQSPLESLSPQLPSNKIFSSSLTFKQCVNILHYCRLVYKYVTSLKSIHPSEQNQIKILSTWVLLLMEEIKKKINENGIVYQGENVNVWLREKKLREVTNQYMKKYNTQLGQLANGNANGHVNWDLGLNSLLNYVQGFYIRIDNQINNGIDGSWIFLGHYIVMILDCTNMLKKSYDERNYRAFSNFKQLENFLNKNRDTMDLQSYKVLRKKISFIREKNSNY